MSEHDTTPENTYPEIMTSDQAMSFLQMGRSAFYKALRAGEIPCRRFSQRMIRFHRETLSSWIAGGAIPAAAGQAPPPLQKNDLQQIPATPLSADFLSWWERYPKKIGKRAASSAWRRIKGKPPIEVMLNTLAEQIESEQWLKDAGQYIPNPATYLSQGRWDDEAVEVGPYVPAYARNPYEGINWETTI